MKASISFFSLFAALATAENITYDYVIAGAGTAGMLLAVVLTENPDVTVCRRTTELDSLRC